MPIVSAAQIAFVIGVCSKWLVVGKRTVFRPLDDSRCFLEKKIHLGRVRVSASPRTRPVSSSGASASHATGIAPAIAAIGRSILSQS